MFFQNSNVSVRTRLCVIPALAVLALFGFCPAVAMAQDAMPAETTPAVDPLIGDDGKLKPVVDEYVPMTIENLSKMYWAVALPNIDSDDDIDNYLLINECEMYTKFYHNDFEWQEIRRVTRDYIQKNITQFPQTFEVIMPIYLDRYDIGAEKFLIEPESQFIGVSRLDTRYNNVSDDICGVKSTIENYPRNLVLNFNLPFSLRDIPVKPEVAEFYMQESLRQFEGLPNKLKLMNYERVAFVRLKVTMLQFKEFTRVGNGPLKGVFFARIDGYDIFADQNKRLLMYSESFSNGKGKRRRAKQNENPVDALVLPSEDKGLLKPTVVE
ncbi:DUF4852 domain-containing protein [Micavibrio aeruginosavorus]|uniref:DUF4852 domain-containing protein n=1 Tax=Micavibrio aeruginosavorus (strain ARL-13) TaxID=856793 RepID=G2KRG7_MICAA|nr:DUF4852 domain-containing protein [Micavibrio aeruginosavorus]AEP09529.1 hypothetical protein MICA_1206 [Micavibrio aeruginosavorus ARL-13]